MFGSLGLGISALGHSNQVPRRFTPARLFAASEAGVWYDPSDLTTLYQDTAGTTPVTAAGQTVALMLDKSRQSAFEARRNLLNFSDGLSGGNWGPSGGASRAASPITAPDGSSNASRLAAIGGGSSWRFYTGITVGTGAWAFSLWMRADVPHSVTLVFGSQGVGNFYTKSISITSQWQRVFIAVPNVSYGSGGAMLPDIVIDPSGSNNTIDVFSAQLERAATPTDYQPIGASFPTAWTGTHATQATAASRPTYGVVPLGGRRNLLVYTEDFSKAAAGQWEPADVGSPTRTAVADPAGGTTAWRLTTNITNGGIYQTVQPSPSSTWRFGVTVKAGTSSLFRLQDSIAGNGAYIEFNLSSGTAGSPVNVGSGGPTLSNATITPLSDGWFRCEMTTQRGSGFANFILVVVGASGSTLSFWRPQAENGSTATAYQRVTTQYDVTEAGVQSLSYLSFDGVDDGMATGTITPGSVDKAQVFMGLRKAADAGSGFMVAMETSSNFDANTGVLQAGGGFNQNLGFGSRGTTSATAYVTLAAPVTRVLTGLGDIAGDTATLRLNGAQVAQSTADQGTGNYGTQPLYIGRRGGTAFALNGGIYGLILRFSAANLDTPTITSTETWLNAKTGAY